MSFDAGSKFTVEKWNLLQLYRTHSGIDEKRGSLLVESIKTELSDVAFEVSDMVFQFSGGSSFTAETENLENLVTMLTSSYLAETPGVMLELISNNLRI